MTAKKEEEAPPEVADHAPSPILNPRSMIVEGNDVSGFIGVDPMYQNYSDVGGQPFNNEAELEAQNPTPPEPEPEPEPEEKKKVPAKE